PPPSPEHPLMQPTLLALIIVSLLLTAGGILLWLLRSQRQTLLKTTFVDTRPEFADTESSGAGQAPDGEAEPEAGPETVLSYLDVPTNSGYTSKFASTSPSLFAEDFESSTQPQAFVPSWRTQAPVEAADLDERQRIQRAMQALGDGPVDQAWQTMQGLFPLEGNREAALETMERIAQAFEQAARYD